VAAENGAGQGALLTTMCGARFDGTISVQNQELLEETEREWLEPQTVNIAPNPPPNGPERTVKLAPDIVLSQFSIGEIRLAAGERRIMTALAQYPKGRSKLQIAVLTGYAATGGGFNNYLGALRSRGLIESDGDRLTIPKLEFRRSVHGNHCRRVPN